MFVPKPKKLDQNRELKLPVNSTTSDHQWTKSTRSPTLAFFTLTQHFRCSTWDLLTTGGWRLWRSVWERAGDPLTATGLHSLTKDSNPYAQHGRFVWVYDITYRPRKTPMIDISF